MDRISKPNIFILIVFGFLVTPVIFLLLYWASFSWWFQRELIITFICAPIFIFFLLSLWLDKKFATKLTRYSILTILILIISLLLYAPTKMWLIQMTENNGETLLSKIKDYKNKYGVYPNNLDDPYFNDVSKKALINQSFFYNKYIDKTNGPTFEIYYISFNGYVGHHYADTEKWFYVD